MKKIICMLSMLFSVICYSAFALGEEPLNTKPGFHLIKSSTKNKLFVNDKGFFETNRENMAIDFYENIKKKAPKEIKDFEKSGIEDTHLKNDLSKIKLSFPFTKPDSIKNNELIGYAVMGGYHDGWTGIGIFFEKAELGVCSYNFNNIITVNSPEYSIEYLVNKKPSHQYIAGNYNNGFIYKVIWFDDKKTSVDEHSLECFNKNLHRAILKQMVKLAIEIDSQKNRK